MSYTFDIIGVAPILNFFNYQQQLELNPHRSKTYLGSYQCTLDAFIESAEMVSRKPDWDWDEVVETIVNFWLSHEDAVQHWRHQLKNSGRENLIVARIANVQSLRAELESLFQN